MTVIIRLLPVKDALKVLHAEKVVHQIFKRETMGEKLVETMFCFQWEQELQPFYEPTFFLLQQFKIPLHVPRFKSFSQNYQLWISKQIIEVLNSKLCRKLYSFI